MRYFKPILVLLSLNAYVSINAQLSTNEHPISFDERIVSSINDMKQMQTIIMPSLDMEKIEAEDREDEEYDMPPRFGYPHIVDYNLNNSGTWYKLPNGDKLWQLNVVCPGALSVNFCYDKFWIPEGGKFFVYSKDKKYSIGAFTSKNNKGGCDDVRGFATGLVFSDDVVLEYYQPSYVITDAIISIEYIVHGYRLTNIGKAGTCLVNINCSEGENWQNDKNAVAMIVVNGSRICTGSLINETSLSQKPLFLTANHCIDNYGDAAGNTNFNYFSFMWSYEAPGCDNIMFPPYYTTSGATLIANNKLSDFALLRLTEDPMELSGYTPYYLGWDCSGQSGIKGVCISHPNCDVKKIATVAYQPSITWWPNDTEPIYAYWSVYFEATPNGHSVPRPGSSGAALLTAAHKVIGQLRGGNTSCNFTDGNCYYGRFDVSWNGYGNDSVCRRLNCWLDSLGMGTQSLEGLLVIPSTITLDTDQQLYSNIRIANNGQLIIQGDIELIGNCRLIVESGGILIIDGGTISNVDLMLKAGASLHIINGGVIETRTGFEAPVGAIVDIVAGEIK